MRRRPGAGDQRGRHLDGRDRGGEATGSPRRSSGCTPSGLPYRDIAVLVRGRAAYPALLEHSTPTASRSSPAAGPGLFDRPEALLLGQTFAWLADHTWSPEPYSWGEIPETRSSSPSTATSTSWTADRASGDPGAAAGAEGERAERRPPSRTWSASSTSCSTTSVRPTGTRRPAAVIRLGTLARCSSLLADYESVRRRSRPDPDAARRADRRPGPRHLVLPQPGDPHHQLRQGRLRGLRRRARRVVDAVDLTTVHRAKGLEWRVVFVPSLTESRFPSSKTGRRRTGSSRGTSSTPPGTRAATPTSGACSTSR